MYLFLIIIILILLINFSGLEKKTKLKDPNARFIKINNEKIRYSQKGTGKDILLIHGTPGFIEDWNTITADLSTKYRVTAFDRMGHGYSSANDYSYHIKDNAVFIKELVHQLNLQSPLVIGHSYGGSIIAYMATKEILKNVNYIIIDSPLYEYKADLKYKLVSIPLIGRALAIISSITVAKNEIKKGVSELFFSSDKNFVSKAVAERQKIWTQPKVIYSKAKESVNYYNDLQAIAENYKNINSKITLISSKEKLGTFKNDCERFHQEVKKSELFILKETGHYIQLEKTQEIISIIENNMT